MYSSEIQRSQRLWSRRVSLHEPKTTGRTCHRATTATVGRSASAAVAPSTALSACSELDYGGGYPGLQPPRSAAGDRATPAATLLEWRPLIAVASILCHPLFCQRNPGRRLHGLAQQPRARLLSPVSVSNPFDLAPAQSDSKRRERS